MRSAFLALTVPLLLLTAAFGAFAPQAAAQPSIHVVSGRVVSDAGEPLVGASVNAYTYPDERARSDDHVARNAHAITNEDGRYELKLAAGRGYINVYYEKWRQGDGREIVVDGNLTNVDFKLKTPPPKTAIVSGIVLSPSGEPIADAQVQLQYGCCYARPAHAEPAAAEPAAVEDQPAPSDGSAKVAASPAVWIQPPYDDYQSTTTGPDGRFEFHAYAGPRQLVAWAKGYAQTTVDVEARDNERTHVEIRLEKLPSRDAILDGIVIDAATGLPVRDAHVSVRSLEWGRWAEARTGLDGRYRLQTVPGWTEITVSVWQEVQPVPLAEDAALISRPVAMAPQYYPYSTLIDLVSGTTDHDVELDAKPRPTVALVGYVLDPDAKTGVEGARVHVWNHETGDWGEAITDRTGSFRILVRAGHYSGNAWKEGYLGGTQSFLVQDVASQRVDLLMPKGTTKWAPCYDESDCGHVIAYSTAAGKDSEMDGATAAAAPPAAPGAAPAPARSLDAAESSSPSARGSGAAAFQGSGGGLPPYDPNAEPAQPQVREGATTHAAEVPTLGILALLGVLVVGAFAMRRR